MFELNLIKDKAKARQRRRVIFLAVVSILFLSGLFSIFIGSLFYTQSTTLKLLRSSNKGLEDEIASMTKGLEIDEPKAKLRRNGLILAYREDQKVFDNRHYYSYILQQLWQQRPRTAQFWYDRIAIDLVRPGSGEPERPEHEMLLGFRSLSGNGIVEIEVNKSDQITESELQEIARAMHQNGVFRQLLGMPTFDLEKENELRDTTSVDLVTLRFMPFRIRAFARSFQPSD